MERTFKDMLRERAGELGFLDARVAPACLPAEAGEGYRRWVAEGYHGEMDYMARLVDERATGAEHVLPGARSVIVLAASYYPAQKSEGVEAPAKVGADWQERDSAAGALVADPGEVEFEGAARSSVRVARYALGKDYHYVLKERLGRLVEWLEVEMPGEQWRICTDSAPLMERSYAAAAGLGFIGKSGMLITWLQGTYTFLAEIVTTAEIEPDEPRPGTCGNCSRCLDACPTQAFAGPGVLDARKCISYLTIEKKSELTDAEATSTGEWVFGCDICQDVCPYNKQPEPSLIEEFRPGTVVQAVEPVSTFLEAASNRQFERRFAGSPILRAGKRRVQRLVKSKLPEPDLLNTPD